MEIKIESLEHRYMMKTPFEQIALENITIEIPSGSYTAIIGHTGSGKSTLVQHLNGLLKPTRGKVQVADVLIDRKTKQKQLKALRKKIGMVFQYPEHQLFDETVEKDICFGPLNFGMDEKVAKKRAREVLALVGLSEDVLQKSPFDLSGGQMRRVAIAGVLALDPEVLILDEPTAGLDPRGRREIMEVFSRLNKEKALTIVLVTHNMSDAAMYADKLIVMNKGNVWAEGTAAQIFASADDLQTIGLDVPDSVRLLLNVEKKFSTTLPKHFSNDLDVAYALKQLVNGNR